MRLAALCILSSVLAACSGPPARAPLGRAPIGSSLELPFEPPDESEAPAPAAVPDDIVLRSAQPFGAQSNVDHERLDESQLLDQLSRFDVICLGEAHDSARDHFAELALSEGLERRAHVSGRALGVGFEMFQTPYADALYSYGLGRLDEAGLRERTHYDERWGYPYAYYRPVLLLGRSDGLPLKALNAPRELTHAVAEMGLENLPPRLRRELPRDLNLDDAVHRARFEQLMAGHPHAQATNLQHFYEAQVVWDETMAETAARWVAAHAPSRQLIVLAGSAHCRREAIPARIERRESLRVASVRLSAASPDDSIGFEYSLLFDPR